MIPNITRGSDFGKLMRYLVGPGRANEHTMPHLVTGDPAIMTWFDSSELGAADAAALADDLARPSVLSGRAPKAGAVWHCSLAVAVEDGPLADEQWAEVAQRFMDKMNFSAEASGRSPMPWLAVHHGQSKNGNDHIHLVVSTVREDGTFVDTHRDFARAQQASREIETELGLRQLQGPQVGLGAKGLTGAELNLSGRTGREPSRVTLERAVRAAATMSGTEADFVAAVRGMDIRIAPYFAAGRSDVVAGYKVGLKGPGERMFGGGHLSKDLSLPRLRLRWEDTPQAHLEAAKQWRRSDRETRVVGAAPRGSGCCCGRHPTAGPVDRWAITGRRTVRPAPTDAALLAYQFPIGGQGTVGQAIFPRQLTNTLFAISSGGAGDEASPDRRVDRGRGPPRLGAGHRRTAGDSRTCACRPVPHRRRGAGRDRCAEQTGRPTNA